MIRKTVILILAAMLLCFTAACGQSSDEDSSDMRVDPKTADSVNLSRLPENCDLIPFDKFKEGFAFVSNTNWEVPPATLEEIDDAFGEKGVYYAKCDVVEDGVTYKTYAWFSDEEWLDSTVSVAVTFKVDDNGKQIYYSYVSQGIDYTDVQQPTEE